MAKMSLRRSEDRTDLRGPSSQSGPHTVFLLVDTSNWTAGVTKTHTEVTATAEMHKVLLPKAPDQHAGNGCLEEYCCYSSEPNIYIKLKGLDAALPSQRHNVGFLVSHLSFEPKGESKFLP